MKIIVAQAAGFCMGVKRAVDQALSLAEDKSATTYTLGPLIHNKQTIDMLRQRGVRALDEGESADNAANSLPSPNAFCANASGFVPPPNLLIRAHGVPPDVADKYRAQGYNIIDGTCPKVKTVHKVIEKHRNLGYEIIITGDEGHAEVIGLLGYAGDMGHLIQTPDDVGTLPLYDKICLVSQTTFDMALFDDIAELIGKRFEGRDIIIKKTICTATDERQTETQKLARVVDALIVVGGKNSANTQRLVKIARDCGTHTQAIETEEEIEWEPLAECKTVGVTAGASTPNWMIKRVCDHLQFLSQSRDKNAAGRVMRALDTAANLNLFVAAGAVATFYVSCVMQDITFSLFGGAIALLYFISVYLWNSLSSLENTLHLDISKYRFYNKYPKSLFFLSGASVAAALVSAWLINTQTFYLMFIASLLGMAYHATIVPKTLQKIIPYGSLRDIPSSRDLFVALAWATILTFLPQTTAGTLAVNPITLAVFAIIFMLSFTRSLIFDLRDIEGDRIMGRETLITIIGEKRARKAIGVIVWGSVLLLMAIPAIMGFTTTHAVEMLRFLSQAPALIYAAIFVKHNAKIRQHHSALFCLLADGLFYLAAAGAFFAGVAIK